MDLRYNCRHTEHLRVLKFSYLTCTFIAVSLLYIICVEEVSCMKVGTKPRISTRKRFVDAVQFARCIHRADFLKASFHYPCEEGKPLIRAGV